MFDLKNNSDKVFDMTVPKVKFANIDMMFELSEIFKTDKNIYYYMGLVLLRLGFEAEDSILFCNYNKDSCSFECIANDEIFYKIRIDKESKEIVVNTLNNEFGYLCEEQSFSEIGMRISLSRYSINCSDRMIFTRYLSRDNMRFRIETIDFVWELELDKPKDLELPLFENGVYVKYKLDNEYELMGYITQLNETMDICDVYQKLSEVYLGDVSKYPKMELKKYKKVNDSLKLTDIISLRYGQFEQFGRTNYGRTVFLDKDNNWSYETPIATLMSGTCLISYNNGIQTCMVSVPGETNNIIDYITNEVKNDMEMSLEDVSYTRKRVLEMFNNGSN